MSLVPRKKAIITASRTENVSTKDTDTIIFEKISVTKKGLMIERDLIKRMVEVEVMS